LRLDRTGGLAPGNKSFKLREYIAQANRGGIERLVSFGGAWSNHLHALAALGQQHGIDTVGIVRGEATEGESAMMADASTWGMRIHRVSRAEYRQRNDSAYQQALREYFAPCLLIPEGGASITGAQGCTGIADIIRRVAPQSRRIVLPVGTGTTLAGLASSAAADSEIVGISALKGAADLEQRVASLLASPGMGHAVRWSIRHDFHCGGFARVNAALREFILAFEAVQGVQLEPVYTGKMLFAIHQLINRGEWDAAAPVLAIHTGGLQGRRGYPWLS
jgi:1-aminocyclopropane-1-carboxylate deaminase/D-cysteine desulfhydrase-like pyridoxal-dependent ACC family enzyme